MSISVTLPWPDRRLFPNARVFWATKAKLVKSHRRLAYFEALKIQDAIPAEIRANESIKINYTIQCVPKINRHRDEDGILSACKSYLDGVSDAIGINDRRFHIKGVDILPAEKPGSITLTFWWEEQ